MADRLDRYEGTHWCAADPARDSALSASTVLIRFFFFFAGSMMTSGERYVKDALVVAVLVGIVAASGGLAAVAVKLFV